MNFCLEVPIKVAFSDMDVCCYKTKKGVSTNIVVVIMVVVAEVDMVVMAEVDMVVVAEVDMVVVAEVDMVVVTEVEVEAEGATTDN